MDVPRENLLVIVEEYIEDNLIVIVEAYRENLIVIVEVDGEERRHGGGKNESSHPWHTLYRWRYTSINMHNRILEFRV